MACLATELCSVPGLALSSEDSASHFGHTLHLLVVVVDNPAALAVIAQRLASLPSLGAVYDLAPGFVGQAPMGACPIGKSKTE